MHAGTHTHQLSLPSNFHLPHPQRHFPTPSRSPALSSRPLSPGQRSSLDTPLAVYATHRHKYRILVQPDGRDVHHRIQVPLSALSPPSIKLGGVGGHFNSTTKIKCVPLPTIYTRHQVSQRGIRRVGLHTDRYLPSSRHSRTVSDSLLNLPALENRPKTRLVGQEARLQRTRLFKSSSGVLPHRMEQPFFMSGHSARIIGKHDFPMADLEEMKAVHYAENSELYFGRGVGPGSRGLQSGVVQRFEVRLKTALEQSRNYGLGDDMDLDVGHYSRASRPSRGVTPAPTIMEDPREMHMGNMRNQRQTFVTESKTGSDA